jgi:hypothetical protein
MTWIRTIKVRDEAANWVNTPRVLVVAGQRLSFTGGQSETASELAVGLQLQV